MGKRSTHNETPGHQIEELRRQHVHRVVVGCFDAEIQQLGPRPRCYGAGAEASKKRGELRVQPTFCDVLTHQNLG